MKLNLNFTEDLNNPSSTAFKNLAKIVEDALLAPLQKSVQGIAAVEVYGFRSGSVIAEYNIIMNVDAPAVVVSDLQSAVQNVVQSGNLTGLDVDPSYVSTIRKLIFFYFMIISDILSHFLVEIAMIIQLHMLKKHMV